MVEESRGAFVDFEGAIAMQFVVSKQNLQKELGFVQGVVEKKNTIPVLSNILVESVGENSIRITGTDLDVTVRCDMVAEEITTPDNSGASVRCCCIRATLAGLIGPAVFRIHTAV